MLVTIAIRLPLFLGPVLGGDAAYHARAAVTVLHGGLLYRDVPYTYPPLYAYTEAISIAVLGDTTVGWKATAQIYDLGSIILIFLIALQVFGEKKALFAAGLYAFSPMPLIATSVYASFDSTAVFWMLASILLLLKRKPLPSAVALGIGTAYKYFPFVLLPPLLMQMPGKRPKILYALVSVATVAIIQLPFALLDFSSWLYNVLLYHLERSAGGATIYNLLTPHPQLWDVQTPLTILSPISLGLVFLLVMVDGDKSEQGLLRKMALVMVTAVFFNKVVLFYMLWFIPLICLFVVVLRRKGLVIILFSFVTLQVAPLLAVYFLSANDSLVFGMLYIYLVASTLLLIWLLRDRLISAIRTRRRNQTQARNI